MCADALEEKYEYEPDASPETWEKLYNIVYKERFGRMFDFSKSGLYGPRTEKRQFIMLTEGTELRREYPTFKMSGDCDFNFNAKKVSRFKKFADKEKEGGKLSEENHKKYMELLDKCHNNHHKLWNFSFMPITGGMNNAKNSLDSYDRLDLFVHKLNCYYRCEDTRLLTNARGNKDSLHWYLQSFGNVFGYCKDIYLIKDGAFIENELIPSGRRAIRTSWDVVEYMKIAIKYWDIKKETLRRYGITVE